MEAPQGPGAAAQVMPLLFGAIGAEIDFKTINSSLWPKAVLLVFVGACQ